jgi:hypothetical protein
MTKTLSMLRAGLDLESGLKNGSGWKKSTPLIVREARTRPMIRENMQLVTNEPIEFER